MNSSEQPGQPSQKIMLVPGKWRQRKGVALILVISFIVLMSALVVGFFSRVTTELTGARTYAEGINARQLAESAVSVVMGQIRAATTVTNGCWASQPGMIRVFGGAGGVAGSQGYRFYKLYSSHNLVVTDFSTFKPNDNKPGSGASSEVPIGSGGWQFQPAFFTDLNEPATLEQIDPATGKKTVRYPIFDPSVARIPALGQNVSAIAGTWTKGSVEGCEVSLTDVPTLKLNPAPMPVRWIYVLRDGTLTAPTPLSGPAAGPTGLKANWNNIGTPNSTPSTGVPTKDNPIVGRIAFWTDDDTCKVNVNTAGGFITDESVAPNYLNPDKTLVQPTNPAFIAGSFWDTPRVQTYFDRGISGTPNGTYRGGLAISQPVRNEFQRYPGHPSTTSLAMVMKGLLPTTGAKLSSELLYQMTPRIMSGVPLPGETLPPGAKYKNSMGGTNALITYGQQLDEKTFGLVPDPPSTIKQTFDPNVTYALSNPATWSYHLLSSVDDLYYTTMDIPNITTTDPKTGQIIRTTTDKQLKLTNTTLPTTFTAATIDKARFFLTAHSRSPELNLFGRPRVSIWPIPSIKSEGLLLTTVDPATGKQGIRNPSDDLFQFCSTIGEDPHPPTDPNGTIRKGQFIFDREDPYSSTADFTRLRNRQIFTYLQNVTSTSTGKIPGWGQSFQEKYSANAGRDQILTEIFDYIRTVNLKDTSRDQRIDKAFGRDITKLDANGNPPKLVTAAESLKGYARYAKRGIVVPTRGAGGAGPTSGFGRFPTVSEVSLVFYCGGYVYQQRTKEGTPIGPKLVRYNYKEVDERNIGLRTDAKNFFEGNKNVSPPTPPYMLVSKLMRAFLVIETFNPMQGYGPVTNFDGSKGERIVYEITTPPPFTVRSNNMRDQPLNLGVGQNSVTRSSGSTWAGRNFGGSEGFFHTLQDKTAIAVGTAGYYPFQTPFKVTNEGAPLEAGQIEVPIYPTEDTEFEFSGGKMNLNIRYMDNAHDNLPAHNELVQTLELNWPAGQKWPVPITEREAGRWNNKQSRAELIASYGGAAKYSGEGLRQVTGGFDNETPGFNADQGSANFAAPYNAEQLTLPLSYNRPYFLHLRIDWARRNSNNPWTRLNANKEVVGNDKHYYQRFMQILQPGDTIRSLQAGDTTIVQSTDPRTTALMAKVPVTHFRMHPDYNKQDPNPNAVRRAQTLRCADGQFYFTPTDPVWFPGEADKPTTGFLAQLPAKTRYIGSTAPDLPKNVSAAQLGGKPADFDTGIGNLGDGGFCGKADEGNLARQWLDEWKVWHYIEPYFSSWQYDSPGDTYFSPNRQIPSPVMFGSLLAPTTNLQFAGWKTLLFCPNPAYGAKSPTDSYAAGSDHKGFADPPDHLLLDLFNMPVIEPYAISEPFSTDGKVNLNYQLMPFHYIERSTALRAALQPLRITAIPTNFSIKDGNVSQLAYKGVNNDENLRLLVDRDETLKGFDYFFSQFGPGNNTGKGFFKSASQICEMFLYPKGQPVSGKNSVSGLIKFTPGDSNIKNWWASCAITGDNVREKPYSDLYSRVTTKSNTYTVHYRVQSLRQQPFTGDPNSAAAATYYQTWDESRDKVLSEYRGHTTIERYLDPRDTRFTYTSIKPAPPLINPETQSLEPAYRFRVIYNKRFAPW
ncbi:MAG: Verru_Chthon cassette protein A [Chthoniobacteraceae bacterium]